MQAAGTFVRDTIPSALRDEFPTWSAQQIDIMATQIILILEGRLSASELAKETIQSQLKQRLIAANPNQAIAIEALDFLVRLADQRAALK